MDARNLLIYLFICLFLKRGWISSPEITQDRMNVGCDATSGTAAGEHQDVSRGKWGTEMYGDNYFLRSSGLSWSLVSNLQPTSSSSAHVCASAHACANTFLLKCWYIFFLFLTGKFNSHVYFMRLIVLQRTECQGCCWWLDGVFSPRRTQHFTHLSLTFGSKLSTWSGGRWKRKRWAKYWRSLISPSFPQKCKF